MSSAEDPEKLLDQVVNEMQEDLIKMRQASAQVQTAQGCRQLPECCLHQSNDSATSLYLKLWMVQIQVMASQKQMEAKYKQAQATAVS